ncbi:MAG TPA: hypothetical protein VNL35_15120, partial [Chloroflexota bacterium]|nr:hypothetical protein [Chloroflexota bacterium]
VAIPIAALGFLVVLFLKEFPLRAWEQGAASQAATGEAKANAAREPRPQATSLPQSMQQS